MTHIPLPGVRPADARFSSGPTRKRPGWNFQALQGALLGRSHRSKPGKAKLKEAIDRTRTLLGVPADFKIAIVPASDTGAVEMAMWSMLGARPVDVFAWESFGEEWVTDAVEQLQLEDCRIHVGRPYGTLPDLSLARRTADIVFTQNGTTSGAKIPNFDWIPVDRAGHHHQRRDQRRFRAADRVVEVRCGDLLLAEGAGRRGGSRHADPVAACGCAAGELRARPAAAEDLPHDQEGQARCGAVRGRHHQHALAARHRGLSRRASSGPRAHRRSRQRCTLARMPTARVLTEWVARTPWVDFLVSDAAIRSNTSVCLKVVDARVTALPPSGQAEFAKNLAAVLEQEGVALDAASYRSAPPGLRIWCGATVEQSDLRMPDPLARLGIRRPASRRSRRAE